MKKILTNKVIIAVLSTIVILSILIIILCYNLLKEKNHDDKKNIHKTTQEEVQEMNGNDGWNGVYNNEKMEIIICKFDGYAFVYNSDDDGVRIFQVNDDNTLSFGTDENKIVFEKNNYNLNVTSKKENMFSRYGKKYIKQNFEDLWSGDYTLNGIDLIIRQVSQDKVFFRLKKIEEKQEFYDVALIKENKITFEMFLSGITSTITMEKEINDIILDTHSSKGEFFLGNVKGTYVKKD